MKKDIRSVLKDSIPSRSAAIKSAISLIPTVGGALEHLLFDKADEIRLENIEKTMDALHKSFEKMDAEKIDQNWFKSAEAISVFKELISLIEYESKEDTLKAVAGVYSAFALEDYSREPNKKLILRKISELSQVQRKLLEVVFEMPQTEKTFSRGGLKSTEKAIWLSDLGIKLAHLHSSGRAFWIERIDVNFEMEMLTAAGLLRGHKSIVGAEVGYLVTDLGDLVAKHLMRIV